ncbi:MAG TPA: histone deacetylase [Thermoanaerobaculia bacterium]|nr:histone deacetylase [Thermoanaerobaculia bacterium]
MSQDRNIRRDRRTVRVFTEPRCLDHRAPRGYPESPDRLTGVMSHLAARGWPITDVGVAREVAEPAVAAVHDPAYVERFRRAAERGDALLDSADNPLSAGTWEAAWAAVSATLAAAEHATENGGGYAFAAVRPPGHHAEKALAMGFCFFNNVAVAAQHLRGRGAERVAIFDFDVHHGNGTQHLFEERADVLYASTHQFPFYPGTGAAGETGRGPGRGRRSTCRSRRAPATRDTRRRSPSGSCRRSPRSGPTCCCCRPGSTPGAAIRSAAWRSPKRASLPGAGSSPSSPIRSRKVGSSRSSKGVTISQTCRCWWTDS